jgi:hypothetical protein
MRNRAAPLLILPLIWALAACERDRAADQSLPHADTVVERAPTVPGAPGSITTDVDRPPRPRLAPDTLPSPPDTLSGRDPR